MTISTVTRREQVRTVADRFKRSYGHYIADRPLPWTKDGRTRDQVFEQLDALDVESCSYDDVDQIIGNDSWVSLKCDECGTENETLIRIGDEPDYEARWVDLCSGCMGLAVAALKGEAG